jgi:hypothetical protein
MTEKRPRTVTATRYVTPLHEGGSLPAIVEADDDGMYVLKFRGAGQGPKVLIAELIAGEIARALGLPIPEIVLIGLDADLARTEPDPEIQELIKNSAGLNLALDYLPGSVMFDPVVEKPRSELASDIVWFDAYVTNVDRTARNANMLMWHRQLTLIDHGAALYFHHSWDNYLERSVDAFHREAQQDCFNGPRCLAERPLAVPFSRGMAGRLHPIPGAAPGRAAPVCRGGDPCTITARMITL